MRTKTLALILLLVTAVTVATLVLPIGGPSCNGNDCFTVGPIAPTNSTIGPGGRPAQTLTASVVFSGVLTYSDNSTQAIASSKTLLSTATGPSGKTVGRMQLGIALQVNAPVATSMTLTGYYDEVAYASGWYYRITHNPVSQIFVVRAGGGAFALANLTHPASDITGWVPPAFANQTGGFPYKYSIAGAFNFSIYQPYNRSISSIFAWPQIGFTVSSGTPTTTGGGGGGQPPRKGSVVGPVSNGVRYQWYQLGTFPAFAVVATGSGKSVLQRLGIV